MKWYHYLAIALLLIGTSIDQVSTLNGFKFGNFYSILPNELNSMVLYLTSLGYWTFFDGIILFLLICPYIAYNKNKYFSRIMFTFCLTLGSYRLLAGVTNIQYMVSAI